MPDEHRTPDQRYTDLERQRETLHLLVDYYIEAVLQDGEPPPRSLSDAAVAIAAQIETYLEAILRDIHDAEHQDVRVGLRLTDAQLPAGRERTTCAQCGAAIAVTPRPVASPPVCLQCYWEVAEPLAADEDEADGFA